MPVSTDLVTIRVVLWARHGGGLVTRLTLIDPWERGPDGVNRVELGGQVLELAEVRPRYDRAHGLWFRSAEDRAAWLDWLTAAGIEFATEE